MTIRYLQAILPPLYGVSQVRYTCERFVLGVTWILANPLFYVLLALWIALEFNALLTSYLGKMLYRELGYDTNSIFQCALELGTFFFGHREVVFLLFAFILVISSFPKTNMVLSLRKISIGFLSTYYFAPLLMFALVVLGVLISLFPFSCH